MSNDGRRGLRRTAGRCKGPGDVEPHLGKVHHADKADGYYCTPCANHVARQQACAGSCGRSALVDTDQLRRTGDLLYRVPAPSGGGYCATTCPALPQPSTPAWQKAFTWAARGMGPR